jgi:hypothetical protein
MKTVMLRRKRRKPHRVKLYQFQENWAYHIAKSLHAGKPTIVNIPAGHGKHSIMQRVADLMYMPRYLKERK